MTTIYTFQQFEKLLETIRRDRVTRWADVEEAFLSAISAFDSVFVAQQMGSGDYKAKARYYNEAVAALIENGTGTHIGQRGKRKGMVLPRHDVDLVFPDPLEISPSRRAALKPIAAGETKIAGTPPYPGNHASSSSAGRPVSQDLDKRVREMMATSIDLKTQWSPGPVALSQAGLAAARPLYVVFYGCRIAGPADQRGVIRRLGALARLYVDAVGLFMYHAPNEDQPTTYETIPASPGLTMDAVIEVFCRCVRNEMESQAA